MDALEAIRTHRRVRKYQPQSVSDKDIEELLTCAMYALSAGNQQSWQFLVITE
jgi:nitroreductase